MGNCHNFLRKSEIKVSLLVVGLDNAGKTTVSKLLQKLPINVIAPTVGYSSDQFKFRHFLVTMIDVGGGKKIRAIWKNYCAEVHGVIYVVDSADHGRLDEAKTELSQLLCNDLIQGKPLLLFANKQDKHEALDEVDISRQLNLEAMVNEYKCLCKVEMTSAILGKKDVAIKNGLKWLLSDIEQHYQTLNQRVERDVKERDIQIEKEMAEKRERIRLRKEAAKAAEGNESERRLSVGSRISGKVVADTLDRAKNSEERPMSTKHESQNSSERIVHSGLGDEILDDVESNNEISIPGSVPELRCAPTVPMRGNESNRMSSPNGHLTSNKICESPRHFPELNTSIVSDASWTFVNDSTKTGDFEIPIAEKNGIGKNHKVAPYNSALDNLPLPGAVHPSKKLAPIDNQPKAPEMNKDLPKLPPVLFTRPNVDIDDDIIV